MTDYSISTCIRNDKPLKRNNKYPVYLRVRVYNRETKVPTNIEVDKNGWDVKRREPKEKSLKIVLSKKILGLESYLNNCINRTGQRFFCHEETRYTQTRFFL